MQGINLYSFIRVEEVVSHWALRGGTWILEVYLVPVQADLWGIMAFIIFYNGIKFISLWLWDLLIYRFHAHEAILPEFDIPLWEKFKETDDQCIPLDLCFGVILVILAYWFISTSGKTILDQVWVVILTNLQSQTDCFGLTGLPHFQHCTLVPHLEYPRPISETFCHFLRARVWLLACTHLCNHLGFRFSLISVILNFFHS